MRLGSYAYSRDGAGVGLVAGGLAEPSLGSLWYRDISCLMRTLSSNGGVEGPSEAVRAIMGPFYSRPMDTAVVVPCACDTLGHDELQGPKPACTGKEGPRCGVRGKCRRAPVRTQIIVR